MSISDIRSRRVACVARRAVFSEPDGMGRGRCGTDETTPNEHHPTGFRLRVYAWDDVRRSAGGAGSNVLGSQPHLPGATMSGRGQSS
jgi:hypothetical protein